MPGTRAADAAATTRSARTTPTGLAPTTPTIAVAAPSSADAIGESLVDVDARPAVAVAHGVDDVEHVERRDLAPRPPGSGSRRRRRAAAAAPRRPRDGGVERRPARARTASTALRRFGSRSRPSRPATAGAASCASTSTTGSPAARRAQRPAPTATSVTPLPRGPDTTTSGADAGRARSAARQAVSAPRTDRRADAGRRGRRARRRTPPSASPRRSWRRRPARGDGPCPPVPRDRTRRATRRPRPWTAPTKPRVERGPAVAHDERVVLLVERDRRARRRSGAPVPRRGGRGGGAAPRPTRSGENTSATVGSTTVIAPWVAGVGRRRRGRATAARCPSHGRAPVVRAIETSPSAIAAATSCDCAAETASVTVNGLADSPMPPRPARVDGEHLGVGHDDRHRLVHRRTARRPGRRRARRPPTARAGSIGMLIARRP